MNLTELTGQMEENNRSNYEIERHTRNARAHLLEIKKTMSISVGIQAAMAYSVNTLVDLLTGNALAQLEKDREMMRLLQGLGGKDSGPEAPKPYALTGGPGVGTLATAAAGGIALAMGIIAGQVKAIKAYAKLLTPKFVTDLFKGIKAKWLSRIDSIKVGVSSRISALGLAISGMLDNLKAKFAPNPDSVLGKALARFKGVFTNFGNRIRGIVTPFQEVALMIKNSISGPAGKIRFWFQSIGAKIKRFGKLVAKIAGVIGKVFAPIAIVVTAWETVTGFIDGYAEDGILGGLKGAISGFFTSLVTVPLDMVVNAAAWLLKKAGLISPETAADVKEFSFTDLFNDMLDGVFKMVKGAVDWVKTLFSDPVKALKELWSGLFGEEGLYNILLWKPLSTGIDWIMKKFEWKEEGAPKFDLYTTVSELWITIIDKVKKGFEDFGDFIASIPARLKLVALQTIKALPLIGSSISDDSINAAAAAVNNPTKTDQPITGSVLNEMSMENEYLKHLPGQAQGMGNLTSNTTNIGGDSVTVAPQTPTAKREADGQQEDLGWGSMSQADYVRQFAN